MNIKECDLYDENIFENKGNEKNWELIFILMLNLYYLTLYMLKILMGNFKSSRPLDLGDNLLVKR